ncbi:hypothetical protein GCM10009101_15290 [Brevundimonas lenta]
MRDEHGAGGRLADDDGALRFLQGGRGQFRGASALAVDQHGDVVEDGRGQLAATAGGLQDDLAAGAGRTRGPGLITRQEAAQNSLGLHQATAGIAAQVQHHVGVGIQTGQLFAHPATQTGLEALDAQDDDARVRTVGDEGRLRLHDHGRDLDRLRLSGLVDEGQGDGFAFDDVALGRPLTGRAGLQTPAGQDAGGVGGRARTDRLDQIDARIVGLMTQGDADGGAAFAQGVLAAGDGRRRGAGVVVVQQVQHFAQHGVQAAVIGGGEGLRPIGAAGLVPVHAVKLGIVVLGADLAPDAVEHALVHARTLPGRYGARRGGRGCGCIAQRRGGESGSGDKRKANRG